jgi:hypothetical protein
MRSLDKISTKATIALKAIRELGAVPVGLNLFYQFGLWTGWHRFRTRTALQRARRIPTGTLAHGLFSLPDRIRATTLLPGETHGRLLQQADEALSGRCRIFHAIWAPVIQESGSDKQDWTRCKPEQLEQDIKFLWEPARFGWVYILGMAYLLTGREVYPQAFWDMSTRFFSINPPYSGWQWVSAQEVALRLMSLVYASQVFAGAPGSTPERQQQLARWIAIHASRIPPTLVYARSQNNNHLLSEAAGLFSAGIVLPHHPDSSRWKNTGWRWFGYGLQAQLSDTGAYIQHSANYHRLMLQLVTWMELLRKLTLFEWSPQVFERIRVAGSWLAALLDPQTGQVPNLGPNDGAYILPLTQCAFEDYRPALQAFWRLFNHTPLFPPGPWDDLSGWLGIKEALDVQTVEPKKVEASPLTLRHTRFDSWCYLRAARFDGRPGHADQLHLDLWWKGINIALDPGTYQYNADPPWDNALTHTAVHNTLTLGNQEQMTRASRFLYLDWAQAEGLKKNQEVISAWHDGYRKLGLKHIRTVKVVPWGWRVEDQITPLKDGTVITATTACLHWLVPDWEWQIEHDRNGIHLALGSPGGLLRLSVDEFTLRPVQRNNSKTISGAIRDH